MQCCCQKRPDRRIPFRFVGCIRQNYRVVRRLRHQSSADFGKRNAASDPRHTVVCLDCASPNGITGCELLGLRANLRRRRRWAKHTQLGPKSFLRRMISKSHGGAGGGGSHWRSFDYAKPGSARIFRTGSVLRVLRCGASEPGVAWREPACAALRGVRTESGACARFGSCVLQS